MGRLSLVLANLGTPAAPTAAAVRAFLEEFLSDPLVVDYPAWFWRPVLQKLVLARRPERVAHAYRSIWRDEGSPLETDTRRLVAAVAKRIGGDAHVTAAYRYGERSLARAVDGRLAEGASQIVVVPLFPQRTSSSSGSIVAEVERIRRAKGLTGKLRVAALAPDAPGYVEALADRIREAFSGGPADHLLVSYHGIPVRYDRRERGLYGRDCHATTRALLAHLGWPEGHATHAYQSRFGPEPWLLPQTAERIEALARGGVGHLAVVTPGFVTDGLETLEEIGIRGRDAFEAAGGGRYTTVPAVVDHPRFVDEIVALARAGRG
ncbi:MAG: ferrochelatase [bacterium]